MKTLRIASMVVMVLITIFFIVFAQIQQRFAEDALTEAKEQKELAERHLELAENHQKETEQQTAIARKIKAQLLETERALSECQNN